MSTPKVKIGSAYVAPIKNYMDSTDARLLQRALLPKPVSQIPKNIVDFWFPPAILALAVLALFINLVR